MNIASFRSLRGRILGVMGGLAFLLLAVLSVEAQAPSRSGNRPPPQGDRQPRAVKKADPSARATRKVERQAPGKQALRPAPSLAVLMAAYEGVLKNDEKTNPEIVRALKTSFQKNPSARQTIAKIHRAYQALPPADREKIVGRELARAGGNTRLTREMLEPILARQFRRAPTLLAERAPMAVQPSEMTPIQVSEQEMNLDERTKVADRPARLRERSLGAEAKEGHSTHYKVEYTGLYCRREPSDFWFSCEPYVIFNMKQGDSQWTYRKGPYDDCDSGDHYVDHKTLRSDTPFRNDLYVVATMFEHDVGSIEEIEDAIQSTVDTLSAIVDNWWEVPDWLKDVVSDALTWFAELFGLDDDQIGSPQAIRFTRSYAERHTGAHDWEGIAYDTYLRCTGDMSGPRRQRGDFKVFLNVTPND